MRIDTRIRPENAHAESRRHLPRSIGLLFAAVLIVVAAWGFRALTAEATIEEGPASSGVRLSPASFLGAEELERLVSDYETRLTQHTDASDYRILGSLYMEAGRTEGDVARYLQARDAFSTAMELFPSDPVSRIGAASAAMALHQFDSALDIASEVHEATGRLDALAVVADAHTALGDYDTAELFMDRLVDDVGEAPAVLVREAEWARISGDPDMALELSLRAASESETISNNPRLRSWYLTYAANMRYELGVYDEGLDLVEEAISLDSEADAPRVVRARLLNAVGDYQTALPLLEQVATTSQDPTIWTELGDLYAHLGRQDDANAAYDRFESEVEASSAPPEVYRRAMIFHLAGTGGRDAERAVELAEADLELRTDLGAYDALAWSLYAAGDYEEALAASQQALAMGSADAHFNFHAGMSAAALGEDDLAIRHLNRALEISPGFSPADVAAIEAELARLG